MAFSISLTSTSSTNLCSTHFHKHPFLSFPVSISLSVPNRNLTTLCFAAKSQTGPVKKRSPNKKRKKDGNENSVDKLSSSDVEVLDDNDYENESLEPLPKPPAGFIVDETGRVLMASSKRIATIVDSSNNNPLDCVIRRVFTSSQGDECMLLCPVDTPVQILKSTNIEGWSAVSDEEVENILPTAAYALAKIHMHLVHSGFCYTARGGFCYSDDDIFDFRTGNFLKYLMLLEPFIHFSNKHTSSARGIASLALLKENDICPFMVLFIVVCPSDDGQDVDGLPTEGVEITCFHLDGAHYMIYTPSDPLLFVAVKDGSGILQIADDDLLEDPAVISAIDEETEFNALVEEEAALLESLLGKER
ncbi:hypothetical protein Pint_27442 [Pistacia integerrima]|uniref:Uncharacterized protein n=1 Tax=Pistacia integerrima TaxID=434235 RepID=A0ACC0YSS8_9ROSI|nr:hypothetical protein Pint_27442 [Pistacia integerrima]